MKLLYGCDPEFFAVIENSGKNLAISPALMEKFCGLKWLETDDEHKHPIYVKTEEYSWMQDGVAFELTLRKPHESAAKLYETIQLALSHLEDFLSGFKFEGKELNLFKKPVVDLNPAMYLPFLDELSIYQGFIFGCDPDEDAILPEYICQTIPVAEHEYRYGGGHIHTSGSEYFKAYPRVATKFLAITAGNYATAKSPFHKEDLQRVSTYGMPGRFRPQTYKRGTPQETFGVEYRSPSNAWCSLPKENVEELFAWVNRGVELFEQAVESNNAEVLNAFLGKTIEAITTANAELATQTLNEIGLKQ